MRGHRLSVLALMALALPATPAAALALAFSSPGPGDAPGVVQVDMWFEDLSRTVPLEELQFDADVVGEASLPGGYQLPSTLRTDGGELSQFPFSQGQLLGDPAGPNDVRLVLAAPDAFTLDLLSQLAAAYPVCTGPACALQESGLARARLYLGSFQLDYHGTPVFLKLSQIFGGQGPWPQQGVDPVWLALVHSASSAPYCDDPRGCRIEGLAPEPPGTDLIGLALSVLSSVRRRCGSSTSQLAISTRTPRTSRRRATRESAT